MLEGVGAEHKIIRKHGVALRKRRGVRKICPVAGAVHAVRGELALLRRLFESEDGICHLGAQRGIIPADARRKRVPGHHALNLGRGGFPARKQRLEQNLEVEIIPLQNHRVELVVLVELPERVECKRLFGFNHPVNARALARTRAEAHFRKDFGKVADAVGIGKPLDLLCVQELELHGLDSGVVVDELVRHTNRTVFLRPRLRARRAGARIPPCR